MGYCYFVSHIIHEPAKQAKLQSGSDSWLAANPAKKVIVKQEGKNKTRS